jgi:hypothetical protein
MLALWTLVHVGLAASHADEGTHGIAGRKARDGGQKDGTPTKHWRLILRSPSLQAADNRHQLAISAPLR